MTDAEQAVDPLARVGLVAFGVVHLVLGWLVVTLALGDRQGAATTSGAMQVLADQPLGGALVWAVTIGLFLLAAWQGFEAAVGQSEVKDRLTAAGKTVVYAVIGAGGVSVAVGSGSSQGTDSTTARLMDLPGGQLLVGAVGVGVLAVGVVLLAQAWRESYLDRLDSAGRSGRTGTAYRWVGRVGHVAKGVSLGAVGVLFAYAAITHEPKESGGVDQALRRLLDAPAGPVLVAAIGVGFAAYGVFCFAWARHLDR